MNERQYRRNKVYNSMFIQSLKKVKEISISVKWGDKVYPSLNEAALRLGTSAGTIKKYIKENKPFKEKYFEYV